METRPSASLANRIAAMPPEGPTGFHVAFDTMQARRGRSDPERIGVNGYLLLDIGQYRLVTVVIPLPIFWQMKAMDTVAVSRTLSRMRADQAKERAGDAVGPRLNPLQVGSVWVVDGVLETRDVRVKTRAHAGSSRQKAFLLHVSRLHALERVLTDPRGPRLIESFDVQEMLPALELDGH